MAGPADGVRAQPQGLGECAVGAPSTQRSSADADAVEHVGHSQHGFGGDPWRHIQLPPQSTSTKTTWPPGWPAWVSTASGMATVVVPESPTEFRTTFVGTGRCVIWWSWARGYEAARNAQERSGTLANASRAGRPSRWPDRSHHGQGGGYVPGRVGCVPVASLVVECQSSWSGLGALAGGVRGRSLDYRHSWLRVRSLSVRGGGLAATRLH